MKITSLFWNVWLNNHLASKERREAVWQRFRELIDEYDPDVVGLNEVVTDDQKHEAPLVSILRENGYHAHYEPEIPLVTGRYMGNVLASKHAISDYRMIKLGYNVVADKHGEAGNDVLEQFATISPEGASPFTFGVIHLLPLYLYAIPEHFRQQAPLAKYMNDTKLLHPAIIGGDFNEFKRMPRSFYSLVRKNYKRRTGTYINATWTAYANDWHPVRGNYDHVYWSRNHPKLQLDSFQVSHKHPSDHAPVIAIFNLD